MNKVLLFIVACLPIVLMCLYIYNKDLDKEPTRILRKLFIYGIISVYPIILLEIMSSYIVFDTGNIISLFITIFVSVGLIEEGAKWVIVNKSVYNDAEFNHMYDAIIYCVFISLGFALVENILYVFRSEVTTANGLLIGIFRALTTIPCHTFNGTVMGYYLGLSKHYDINKNVEEAKKYMFLSLIVPILLHTFYDTLIFMGNILTVIYFGMYVIFMIITSIRIIGRVSSIDKNFDGSKYNTKNKKEYISSPDLFTSSLSKVLVITLFLIGMTGAMLFLGI